MTYINRAAADHAFGRTTFTRFTMINKDLLDILACPKCKGPIALSDDEKGLVCGNCRLLYEIIDDIPVMLIDKAKKLGGGAQS